MAFSPADAALEGFRIVRRNPLVLVFWTLAYAVVGLVQLFATRNSLDSLQRLAEVMEAFEAAPPQTIEGWAPVFQAYGDIAASSSWSLIFGLVVGTVVSAAVARAVLKPSQKAFGYMRLGMDELRVFAVNVVLTLLFAGVSCLLVMAAAVLGGVLVAVFTAMNLTPVGVLLMIALVLGVIAFLIWLGVRLSLAVPITLAEGRVAVVDSFPLTRGRFWPLLGMSIIALVLTLIVMLLGSAIVAPLSFAATGVLWGGASEPELLARMTDMANPWVIALQIGNALMTALAIGVFGGPFSAAYRDIKGV